MQNQSTHDLLQNVIRRRTFLVASGLTFCGLDLPSLVNAAESQPGRRAASTILIWLSGGVSHLDTWDL
ncbi:MAG TPA: hypothetical protein VF306_21490, partial [Pirellulales bacterium]